MYELEQIIILKRFPLHGRKLSVLGSFSGKVFAYAADDALFKKMAPGTVMMGFLDISPQFNGATIKKAELISSHTRMDSDGFVWLSRMLEVVYFFLPAGAVCNQVFMCLERSIFFVGTLHYQEFLQLIRAALQIELLSLLGFYPPRRLLPLLVCAQALPESFIDSPNEAQVEFLQIAVVRCALLCSMVEKWTTTCLSTHPRFSSFRALWYEST